MLCYLEMEKEDSTQFSNKLLVAMINELWKDTKIVQGSPRHRQDQKSLQLANGDFKNMIYARLWDVKNQCR